MPLSTTSKAQRRFADIAIGAFATISVLTIVYYTVMEGYWIKTGIYLLLMLVNLTLYYQSAKRAFDPNGTDTLRWVAIAFAILLAFGIIMGLIIDTVPNDSYGTAAIILWFASAAIVMIPIDMGEKEQNSNEEKEGI